MGILDRDEDFDKIELNAWKAGAAAMVEHLFNLSSLDENCKKRIISETVEELVNKENNHG
jgi:hypothetical protein